MQSLSRNHFIHILLGLATVILIALAIAMELLPEEEAKTYVVPVLVAALFAGIAHTAYKQVKFVDGG
jgi:hypothetical protein